LIINWVGVFSLPSSFYWQGGFMVSWCLFVHVSLSPNNLWTNWQILMNFCMNVMPLEATWLFYFLISYHHYYQHVGFECLRREWH
jgi:hypothetical protein